MGALTPRWGAPVFVLDPQGLMPTLISLHTRHK
jgi:hypothetical protein